MKNSLIRVLISLFLCCCLVLNVVSIPAKAVTPGMVAVGTVSALVLIPAILYGLGVMQSSTDTGSAAFNQLVSDCNDHLTNLGWIAAGAATMLSLTQDGSVITYAHRNMIQDIFNWLFSSSVIQTEYVTGTTISANTQFQVSTNSFATFTTDVQYATCTFNDTSGAEKGMVVVYSLSPFQFTTTSVQKPSSYTSNGVVYYVTGFTCPISSMLPSHVASSFYVGSGYSPYGSIQPAYDLIDSLGAVRGVSVSEGLSSGYVASQDTEIETGYETYIQEGIVSIDFGIQFEEGSPYDPDGDDQKYHHWFPVKVPSPDNISNLTQEDAWSGESEVELEYETDTDTGSGSGDGSVNTGTNTGTNTSTNFLESLTQFFTPSGDITMYSLDLKDLFPFCIPFDIYDFLAALSADPVPPVFEFDLNLGVATEPMKIDLSNWSDLAAIIRTLELGLFCVGLALKTRELIGG